MGFNYSSLQNTAQRLIERFGRSATIRRSTPGSGPAHNPGPGSSNDYVCRAVIDEYRAFERDGTLIRVGDRKAMVAAKGLAITPATGDKLILTEGTFAVISVEAVAPGDTNLVWTLQVRR